MRQDFAGSDVASTAWQQRKIARHQFSQEQLEAYGIFELQTLETVLRQEGTASWATWKSVAGRILRKIGWEGEDAANTKKFLDAYYRKLRTHLEKRMLIGKRRENKHDT